MPNSLPERLSQDVGAVPSEDGPPTEPTSDEVIVLPDRTSAARIRSPRLVHSEHAAFFAKQVILDDLALAPSEFITIDCEEPSKGYAKCASRD
jgi:hypothetical protein